MRGSRVLRRDFCLLSHHLPLFLLSLGPGKGRKQWGWSWRSRRTHSWGVTFAQEVRDAVRILAQHGVGTELLTPYLQAVSVVSLSLFFTCGVETLSRSSWACPMDMPAFSAAWRDVVGKTSVSALVQVGISEENSGHFIFCPPHFPGSAFTYPPVEVYLYQKGLCFCLQNHEIGRMNGWQIGIIVEI